MTYSAVELMVPMAFHVTKGGVVVYVSEGPFFDNEEYGELALIIRTTFVGLSYGILIIHFIYRYLVLYKSDVVDRILSSFGMLCIFIFFLIHGVIWFAICHSTIYSDPEIKLHIQKEFEELFRVNSRRLSLLIAMYYIRNSEKSGIRFLAQDVSPAMIRRSWCGVILLTLFSLYAIFTYFILGYKIMKKLKTHQIVSIRTSNLHNQLFKALAVQTFIPMCISFTPCLIAWYTPVIGINVGTWNNYFGVIALSAFPTLDPIAIIDVISKSRDGDDIFRCSILNPLKMRVGGSIYIPINSTFPYPIPANFTCTYKFLVPKNAFLRITVINSLADKDYIEFQDSLGYSRVITVTAIANEEFFATSGVGNLSVNTGPEGNSKALLLFEWLKMPSSSRVEKLTKNANGKYVDCMSIQHGNPITFESTDENEELALNMAHSGYILDNFDSFFIFNGNDTDKQAVGRMSDHIITPFITTNQSVTVLGLTSRVIYSNVIANYHSNIEKYKKYEAAVIIDQQGTNIDSINQTIAVTFIAKDGYQLYLTALKFNEIENEKCRFRAISGTPSPISRELVDYTPSSPLANSFPQQFPSAMFSVELSDCSIYMVMSKNMPDNFYMVQSGRIGYVFTPSFLDSSLSSELDFTLRSLSILTYSTVVESVSVSNDEELSINVYNAKGNSAMSIIVTGNQTGGSAKGLGTSVNIAFNGTLAHGSAKVRYSISQNSGIRFFNTNFCSIIGVLAIVAFYW